MENSLTFQIKALDSGHGYTLVGIMTVNNEKTIIEEHYSTEAALRSRLATGFDVWAAQVDSE